VVADPPTLPPFIAKMGTPRIDPHKTLAPEIFEAIRQFDTCTIANAIEHFGVRLRNEGFTRPGLRCVTGGSPRLLGYAATCRVRSADPPMTGNAYVDRTDWWEAIGALPVPRVSVIQDLDAETSGASTVGEVHAAILKALHCEGVITNGAVRDIPGVSRMQFPMFAAAVSVSHAYMHIVDFGAAVEVFGLPVRAGDLLYADVHGVVSIPHEVAAQIPDAAAAIRSKERRIVDLCQSPEFSLQKLLTAVQTKQ
jgi:4-hydroxy-4-methyl-2-oxoglutarate aldolase